MLCNYIKVVYPGGYDRGQIYTYKNHDKTINAGDKALVYSGSSYSVVDVIDVVDEHQPKATKWVVCKVDMDGYTRSKKAEKANIDKIKELRSKAIMLKSADAKRFTDEDEGYLALQEDIQSLERGE